MAYSHTTFAQLKAALANRLGDTAEVYWLLGTNGAITDELGLYIIEALRWWGLMTGYWRDSGQFPTVASTAFYDNQTLKNANNEPLLSYTIADKDLSAIIQYHLLEPATGSTWTGSEQFTLTDVTSALQRRRDKLLAETGAVITRTTQALVANAQTVDLADTTVQVRRMAWTSVSGLTWPIGQDDTGEQRNYSSGLMLTSGIPLTYSSSSAKNLRYILAPPPNEPGTLETLQIQSGATLTGAGVTLGVPDDMAAVVKWGALADMLGKEGPAQDLPRSYFCERRWALGLELAKIYPTVINAEINGVSLTPESVENLDAYSPNWQSTTGTPTFVASFRNIIGLANAPDGIYSVLLDVVRKAIIPTLDTDFIQVGREYLDPILDYAEHLAAFKSGGMEFRHTLRGAENFFNAALSYNERLAAQHPGIIELIKQSTKDDYVNPPSVQTNNGPLSKLVQSTEQ